MLSLLTIYFFLNLPELYREVLRSIKKYLQIYFWKKTKTICCNVVNLLKNNWRPTDNRDGCAVVSVINDC